MDFIDFKNRWLNTSEPDEDEQWIVFNKSIVQEIKFKAETALFLTGKGLPKSCAPWLEFESGYYDDADQPVSFNDYFGFTDQPYEGYYIIGSQNNFGEWPICLDIKNNDRLVLIDIHEVTKRVRGEIAALFDAKRPNDYDPVIVINHSLDQFVFSALEFRDFLKFARKKEYILPSDIRILWDKLTVIDKDAMNETMFWPTALARWDFKLRK